MNSARVTYIILAIAFLCSMGHEVMSQDKAVTLVGEVAVDQITKSNRIFDVYVNRYEPNTQDIKYLNSLEGGYSVIVYFGSWCRESTKYIPGLVKAIDLADNDSIEIKYIGVDKEKKMPSELLKLFDIKYIPTVVVLKDGKEIGKIVEQPQLPIETELVQILKRLREN